MSQPFFMVDVFADRPYSGNPLPVVIDTHGLSDETMQRIAAEMNFSETTFVQPRPEPDGSYSVRLFTPSREIAFAGHPILGTARVIRDVLLDGADAGVRLALAGRRVDVTFEPEADGSEIAWFHAPPIELGAIAEPEPVARALGLRPQDIATRTPIQVASAGTAAMIVPLTGLDALRRARLDLEAFSVLAGAGFPPLLYLFTWQTHQPDNQVCARFFFEAHGIREDPATGNGAAFLGAYLLAHGTPANEGFELRIEQGHEVRRPSRVMLKARMRDAVQEVRVGGRVILTVRGELL